MPEVEARLDSEHGPVLVVRGGAHAGVTPLTMGQVYGLIVDLVRIQMIGASGTVRMRPPENDRVRDAALALYRAAYWRADRPCESGELWSELRDALGLPPGTSPAPLDTDE